ncbi:MAG: class I SAM-dependent methyltransferase [Betaproteobacteria bacterium]
MSSTSPTLPNAVRARLRARVEAAIPTLHGWTSVDKGARMAELVVAARAPLSVELGVFGGRGTIALAIGHEAKGEGEILAVDPWERAASLEGENSPENDDWWGKLDHDAIYASFLLALRDTGVERWCRVLRQRSSEAVKRVADGSVGVLHQDSNHSEGISSAEVEQWLPKLAPDGFWIADDTDWPTTHKAQARLAELGLEVVEDHASWKVFRRR